MITINPPHTHTHTQYINLSSSSFYLLLPYSSTRIIHEKGDEKKKNELRPQSWSITSKATLLVLPIDFFEIKSICLSPLLAGVSTFDIKARSELVILDNPQEDVLGQVP